MGACENNSLYNTHTPTDSHPPTHPALPPLSSMIIHTRAAALHFLLAAAAAAAAALNPSPRGGIRERES